MSTATEEQLDTTPDAEIDLFATLSSASAAASRIFGRSVKLSPMRPAGQPYRYRVLIEEANGSCAALPGDLSAAGVRQFVDGLAAMAKLAGL